MLVLPPPDLTTATNTMANSDKRFDQNAILTKDVVF